MLGVGVEVFKDVPGYKGILKAVLLGQIQTLVEQLARQTGEESLLLTVSPEEGTLSHLGTDSGQFFIRGHNEIKSQFLGFCLKRNHFESQVRKRGPPAKRPRLSHTLPSPQASSTPRGRRKSTPRFMPSNGRGDQKNLQPDPNHLTFDTSVTTTENQSIDAIDSQSTDGGVIATDLDNTSTQAVDQNGTHVGGEGMGGEGLGEGTDMSMIGDAGSYQGLTETSQGDVTHDEGASISTEDNQMKDGNQELLPVGHDENQQYERVAPHLYPVSENHSTHTSVPSSTPDSIIAPHLRGLAYSPSHTPYSPSHLSFASPPSDSQQRPHCYICDKYFKNASNLKIHMMSHNGVRPYACPYCGRRFIQKNVLKQHLHIHTGQKEFSCAICGKAFTQRATLYKHRKVHEPNKTESATFDLPTTQEAATFDLSKQESVAFNLIKQESDSALDLIKQETDAIDLSKSEASTFGDLELQESNAIDLSNQVRPLTS